MILPYAFEGKKGASIEWYLKLRKLFSLMMELSAEPHCRLFGKIRAVLAGEHLSIENLYREIEAAKKETEINKDASVAEGSTEKIAGGRKKSVKGKLRFISKNPIYRTDIRIDKNGFVFGKYKGHVDGLLTMSPAISRRHCKISLEDSAYYIEDLGSVNHTYVNQKRLVPGERTELAPGDIVQLADIEFEIADEG